MAFAASSLRVWPSHSLGHLLVLAVVAGTSVAVEAVILVQAGNIPRCGERKEEAHRQAHAEDIFTVSGGRGDKSMATKLTDAVVTWSRGSPSSLARVSRGWSRRKALWLCVCVAFGRRPRESEGCATQHHGLENQKIYFSERSSGLSSMTPL